MTVCVCGCVCVCVIITETALYSDRDGGGDFFFSISEFCVALIHLQV